MSLRLGEGSNNFAEIMSLKFILIFASELDCQALSMFGDSMNVINWEKGTQRCIHLRLDFLLEDVVFLKNRFDPFVCRHVYRSHNQEADRASKEGLGLAFGHWKIREHKEGQITDLPLRSFL